MQRLGIFVFYDTKGHADDYVFYVLNSIRRILTRLIIVINGNIADNDLIRLDAFADDIYRRENYGFDGGAYKDTITVYLGIEEVNKWDELVLFNNTFYGPFYPWNTVFDEMENEDADFWGLSSYFEKEGTSFGEKSENVPYHIQGYFIVCRKNLISDVAFSDYWRKLHYPSNYIDAVNDFEIGFSQTFINAGFKCMSYIEKKYPDVSKEKGINLYLMRPYMLISKCQFPVLKYKALNPIYNYDESLEAVNYIQKETEYDIKLIEKHQDYLESIGEQKPLSIRQLELFYKSCENVYVFGLGTYAKRIENIFNRKGWSIKGFIVSDRQVINDTSVIEYSALKMKEKDGLILALGKKNTKEVLDMIGEDIDRKRIFEMQFS